MNGAARISCERDNDCRVRAVPREEGGSRDLWSREGESRRKGRMLGRFAHRVAAPVCAFGAVRSVSAYTLCAIQVMRGGSRYTAVDFLGETNLFAVTGRDMFSNNLGKVLSFYLDKSETSIRYVSRIR